MRLETGLDFTNLLGEEADGKNLNKLNTFKKMIN